MHPLMQPNLSRDNYAWIITKDKIGDGDDDGTIGGHLAPKHLIELLRHPKRNQLEKFRMKDDDGQVYYYGYIAGDYEGFEPLDDYGTPNAGCAWIEYKDKATGEWRVL